MAEVGHGEGRDERHDGNQGEQGARAQGPEGGAPRSPQLIAQVVYPLRDRIGNVERLVGIGLEQSAQGPQKNVCGQQHGEGGDTHDVGQGLAQADRVGGEHEPPETDDREDGVHGSGRDQDGGQEHER